MIWKDIMSPKIILIFALFFFVHCSHKIAKLPVIQMKAIDENFNVANQYKGQEFQLSIPEEWNYKFQKDNDAALLQFIDPQEKVEGYLHEFTSPTQNFHSAFKEYIQAKNFNEIEWIRNSQKNGMEIYYIKGTYLIIEDVLEENITEYKCYIGLYKYQNKLFELLLMGNGDELDFEEDALKMLNSFQIIQNPNIEFHRFQLTVPYQKGWEVLSTHDNEIINWSHLEKNLKLKLNYIGEKVNKEVINNEIDRFRILLQSLEIQYDFETTEEIITKYKNKAVVFIALANWKNNTISIRKYYFSIKNRLYSLEIMYRKLGWEEGIGKEIYKILDAITTE